MDYLLVKMTQCTSVGRKRAYRRLVTALQQPNLCKLNCVKISSRESTYSTVHRVSHAEKDPRVALCREGKVPDIFILRNGCVKNENQCLFFFVILFVCFDFQGTWVTPSFHLLSPMI